MANDTGREYGWDESIENDGPEFITLPDGDYDFTVEKYERGRHPGSDKLPPCNKAVVYLKLVTPEGETTIKHNLFLHSITEGMLCAFFTAIGQRKHGERVTMNWNAVVGSTGRAKVGIRKWISDKDGIEYKANEVKKFYEPKEATPAKEFTPGAF